MSDRDAVMLSFPTRWRLAALGQPARVTDDDDDPGGLGAIPDYPVGVLPATAQALIAAHTLPTALVGGAMLAALASAVGGAATLEVSDTWKERPILWVAAVAPAGAGKSPAQALAFTPLREHDLDVLVDDMTMEALARVLAKANGSAGFDVDELAQLVQGMGEYKGGASGDRGRLLKLWDGAPWNPKRVADGKKGQLGLDLRIAKPTVAICGGLQPHLHGILGGERDGLRPRWLPHLAVLPDALPEVGGLTTRAAVDGWRELLDAIMGVRQQPRTWRLTTAGLYTFNAYRRAWKQQAREPEPPGVSAALEKADRHLARIALVLAEADQPGAGGPVGEDVIERAAQLVSFVLDSWRALPEQGTGLGLTRRDQVLGDAVERLAAWVEDRPARQATTRQIQRAGVAGVRKVAEVKALVGEYEERYPATVETTAPERGGHPVTTVHARKRARARSSVEYPTLDLRAPANPPTRAKSGPVGSPDTRSPDTRSPDARPAFRANGRVAAQMGVATGNAHRPDTPINERHEGGPR
jgi:hypothetical protein